MHKFPLLYSLQLKKKSVFKNSFNDALLNKFKTTKRSLGACLGFSPRDFGAFESEMDLVLVAAILDSTTLERSCHGVENRR